MSKIVDIARQFSLLVQNNRTLASTSAHMRGENDELDVEIQKVENGEELGVDGIKGEAIDVIACALDIIFRHDPNTTNEELDGLMLAKCQKWKDNYS